MHPSNRDIKVANVSSLDWTLKTDIIFPPAEYEAEKIIRETSKDLDSYIVATAVLASLLGLTFVLVVAYLVYLKKWFAFVQAREMHTFTICIKNIFFTIGKTMNHHGTTLYGRLLWMLIRNNGTSARKIEYNKNLLTVISKTSKS